MKALPQPSPFLGPVLLMYKREPRVMLRLHDFQFPGFQDSLKKPPRLHQSERSVVPLSLICPKCVLVFAERGGLLVAINHKQAINLYSWQLHKS
jgi:hypothetical protein